MVYGGENPGGTWQNPSYNINILDDKHTQTRSAGALVVCCLLGCWWSTRQPFTVMLHNNAQRCDHNMCFANSTACCALRDVGKGKGREEVTNVEPLCVSTGGVAKSSGAVCVWCMCMCLTEARGRASKEVRGPVRQDAV